ncbi:MAG: hypothetical protein LBP59_05025 [Planctomycetaceae bacterium]|jgi:hypothetical protein|nr:hypothetical protein [Planctomycetaceae bacterium]
MLNETFGIKDFLGTNGTGGTRGTIGTIFVTKNHLLKDRRRLACKKRNAGAKGSHSPQDRGRLACKRLYSTANERA